MAGRKKPTRRRKTKATSRASRRKTNGRDTTTSPPKGAVTRRGGDELLESIGRGVVSPVLHDPQRRTAMGLPASEEERGAYMVELNVHYRRGLAEADKAFRDLWAELFGQPVGKGSLNTTAAEPVSISKSYLGVKLSVREWRDLIARDAEKAGGDQGKRIIYKLWPDFEVKPLIDRSVATVKADAAFRAFSANGRGITWAVVDSGIDGTHPHFGSRDEADESVLYHPHVVELHRDFSNGADIGAQSRARDGLHPALVDEFGHGTHVAGIISGGLPEGLEEAPIAGRPRKARPTYAVYEQVFESNTDGSPRPQRLPRRRPAANPSSLRGVAPGCLLVSLKVMDGLGNCRVSDVMRALVYVREQLNSAPKILRVHGVNISIGYDFDAQMFACGQSPLCVEVDRLVRSGVVVVVAAGNTGYGELAARTRVTQVGLANTINDPGNAALAITVGATHRDSPHTYGVSFFSSKGPTGDGRLKPDVVAPGERITSCASVGKCQQLGINAPPGAAAYVDDSGTSLAAPHVSGAIAAFLSIRNEFIQRPEEVKRIFLSSATSLGRERYFEGHGLVDLMRAIQSV